MLSLLCCSCSERDLGEGYYFLPKYESVDIGYPNEEAIIYQSKEENQFNNIKINGDVLGELYLLIIRGDLYPLVHTKSSVA